MFRQYAQTLPSFAPSEPFFAPTFFAPSETSDAEYVQMNLKFVAHSNKLLELLQNKIEHWKNVSQIKKLLSKFEEIDLLDQLPVVNDPQSSYWMNLGNLSSQLESKRRFNYALNDVSMHICRMVVTEGLVYLTSDITIFNKLQEMTNLLSNGTPLFRKNPDGSSQVSKDDIDQDIWPIFHLNRDMYRNKLFEEKYKKWVMNDFPKKPIFLFKKEMP